MAEAYSPEWWLDRLIVELGSRQDRYNLLDSYARSNPPMPPRPDKGKATAAFDYLRKISRVNWADIIVESLVERMNLLRFRSPDSEAEQALWVMWVANGLTTTMSQLYRTKATLGEACTIVGAVDPRINAPRVTCEDPRQVIVEVDPIDKTTTLAALKVFPDTVEAVDRAYLYLAAEEGPALLYRATRPRKKDARGFDYTARKFEFEEGPEQLPTTQVPVTWYPNRADLFGRTMGEFEHVLDDLNRIALMVLQRVQVAVLQAFRQRAVKGELPENDNDGNPIDYNVLFSNDPAALWQLPKGVELWESSGVDLTPILESVKADVRDLAGRARCPLYYFYPNEGGSAEGAVTQREGLIFRTTARTTETSGPHARTAALMLEAAGMEPAPVEPVWLRPDLATLAERYDAAAKARTAGVSPRTVLVDILQFTPTEADRELDAIATDPIPE